MLRRSRHEVLRSIHDLQFFIYKQKLAWSFWVVKYEMSENINHLKGLPGGSFEKCSENIGE